MLTTYRRHRKECERRSEGRKYRRCRCPIWVDGFLAGQEIRKSLDTADWQKAQDKIREWEAQDSEPRNAAEPVMIEQAGNKFIKDAKARKLNESTIYKYNLLFKQLKTFAQKGG
jgi:integrase/recombinase XerD